MARYRRKRYYRKRARYSPNIVRIGPNSFNIQPQTREFGVTTLIENQGYDPSRSNTIITVKNPELSIEFENSGNGLTNIESCTAYILFIPEGYTAGINTPIQHPEWIMAYKFYGSPNYDGGFSKFVNKIKTRLSRKLNTGDRIVLLVEATNTSQQYESTMEYQGLVHQRTKP